MHDHMTVTWSKSIFLLAMRKNIPYFSAYKTEAFPFQNNPKNLDPSYKMDLDL